MENKTKMTVHNRDIVSPIISEEINYSSSNQMLSFLDKAFEHDPAVIVLHVPEKLYNGIQFDFIKEKTYVYFSYETHNKQTKSLFKYFEYKNVMVKIYPC